MGATDFQSVTNGYAERADSIMELLGTGNNGQDNLDVLCGLLQPIQSPRKRLGKHPGSRIRVFSSDITFRLRGLV